MPYVPGTVARRPVETSRKQVRKALLVLEELDDHLRVLGASTLPRHHEVRSLAAARRRVWLAMAALGSPLGAFGSSGGVRGVGGQRASQGRILLQAAGAVIGAVRFLVQSFWRCMRAVVRLVYVVRGIWP